MLLRHACERPRLCLLLCYWSECSAWEREHLCLCLLAFPLAAVLRSRAGSAGQRVLPHDADVDQRESARRARDPRHLRVQKLCAALLTGGRPPLPLLLLPSLPFLAVSILSLTVCVPPCVCRLCPLSGWVDCVPCLSEASIPCGCLLYIGPFSVSVRQEPDASGDAPPVRAVCDSWDAHGGSFPGGLHLLGPGPQKPHCDARVSLQGPTCRPPENPVSCQVSLHGRTHGTPTTSRAGREGGRVLVYHSMMS